MTKCIICNNYVEAPELMNEQVCSAICLGKKYERKRILELIDELNKDWSDTDWGSSINPLVKLKQHITEGERI